VNGLKRWKDVFENGEVIVNGRCFSLLDDPNCPVDDVAIQVIQEYINTRIYNADNSDHIASPHEFMDVINHQIQESFNRK
jgi:S-adenosylmethionine synthetase